MSARCPSLGIRRRHSKHDSYGHVYKDCRDAAISLLAALDRARDARPGTTTAEDVRARIQAIYDRTATGGFSEMYRNGLLAALAEFAPGDTPHPTDIHPAPDKENQ